MTTHPSPPVPKGGSKDGMNKNPLMPTTIVPVAVVFPPLDGAVVAVIFRAVDISKLKADPIIANPPLSLGGWRRVILLFAVQFLGSFPEGCLRANAPFFICV